MIAFYNEIDDFACGWLSNLMDAGLITPGYISNESIEDITPSELVGYDRVHFFAGIGGWDYALNLAGWGDRLVWTGSCPCQPFSTAGKGAGTADERHLWPAVFHLIEQCRPNWVFGEQVASSDALAWLDLVCTDLEGAGYAARALDMCAAGFGAPHIRQRLYWVADRTGTRRERQPDERSSGLFGTSLQPQGIGIESSDICAAPVRMGDSQQQGLEERLGHAGIPGLTLGAVSGQALERAGFHVGGLANGDNGRHAPVLGEGGNGMVRGNNDERALAGPESSLVSHELDDNRRPGPTNGAWRNADWLFCRDGRWRPVEPSTFCLAHGVSNRMGLLRGYGNAIVPQEAAEFIKAVIHEI